MGGNFVYVRELGEAYEIVYVGEAQNLLTGAREHWAEAVKTFGAAHLFTRLNVTERVRQHEYLDITQAASPPMPRPEAEH
jgi:hypothetical protein